MKVALIVSDSDALMLLENFDIKGWSVSVHVLDSIKTNKVNANLPFDFYVHEEKTNMPGYIRGIEKFLGNVDSIFIFNDVSMASFQVARFCQRVGCQLFVLYFNSAYRSYSQFKNVVVVRNLVHEVAKCYFVPGASFAEFAKVEGVASSKVLAFRNRFPVANVVVNSSGSKFRKYIGFSDSHFLIGLFAPLEQQYHLESFFIGFQAFLSGIADENERSLVRCIVIGMGGASRQLKECTVKHGVGKSIAFLEQDTGDFCHDLMCALDAAVFAPLLLLESDRAFPIREEMHLGIALGTMLAVHEKDAFSDLVPNRLPRISNWAEMDLASALQRLYQLRSWPREERIQQSRDKVADYRELADIIEEVQLQRDGTSILATENSQVMQRNQVVIDAIQANQHDRIARPVGDDIDLSLAGLNQITDSPTSTSDEYVQACIAKAVIFRKLGDLDGASVELGNALDVSPGNPAIFLELGHLAMEGEAYDEAVTFYKQVYQQLPNEGEALFGIGKGHAKVGLWADAMYWLEKAVEACPGNKVYSGTLAHTCLQAPDTKKAKQVLEKAIDTVGEDPSLCLALGRIYLSQGKPVQGQSLIKKGLG